MTAVAVERDFIAGYTAVERRRRRYRLHAWRNEHAERLGVSGGPQTCLTPMAGAVTVRIGADGTTHTSGVRRCGSPWVCPVCTPVVRERRAQDIDAAVRRWLDDGGEAWFGTLTFPHNAAQSLAFCWQRAQRMWSWAFTGHAGRAFRQSVSAHHIRAVEVTRGANGWHVHHHVVFLCKPGQMTWSRVVGRWRDAFHAEGLVGFRPKLSCEIHEVRAVERIQELSGYLAKVEQGWGIGLELARADLKSSKGVGPAQLLELATLATETGEATWLAPWVEFERVSKGRRAVIWSQGLRDAVGLGEELTDEEAAAGPEVSDPVATFQIEPPVWMRWRAAGQLGILYERLTYCDPPDGVYRLSPG